MGLFSRTRTRPITDAQGRPLPGSIATMERVRIGGLDQLLVIRGQRVDNPLLLWLSGGPGASDLGALQRFNPELERHFTIVHWSYRGTPQSARMTPEDYRQDLFISDLHELVQHLLQRFGRPKLFLAAQSFGTGFGYAYAQQHPELLYAWVGVNQCIERDAEERYTYDLILRRARELGNQKAVAEMERVAPPQGGVYPNPKDIFIAKNWTRKLRMVTVDPVDFNGFAKATFLAPEFTWGDCFRFFRLLTKAVIWAWPDFAHYNFPQQAPVMQLPVFFVMGRHDPYFSTDLVQAYVDQLQAPEKELFVHEQSGHIVCYEAPEWFNRILIDRLLPLATGDAR